MTEKEILKLNTKQGDACEVHYMINDKNKGKRPKKLSLSKPGENTDINIYKGWGWHWDVHAILGI